MILSEWGLPCVEIKKAGFEKSVNVNTFYFFRNLMISTPKFCKELSCFSKPTWIIHIQISHGARCDTYLSNEITKQAPPVLYVSLNFAESPKTAADLNTPKVGHSSEKNQHPWQHSLHRDHTFLHVKFEPRFASIFTKKSMSNKKSHFS
jgi:hypothetical protein